MEVTNRTPKLKPTFVKVQAATQKQDAALEITSFSFSYPDHSPTLQQVDWHLDQGAFVLLIGATGSGKTTLLRCLKPELAPTGKRSGCIKAFGEDLISLGVLESAQYIGYVSQDPENQIVCDNVWHELAFGMENIGMDQNLMRRRVAEIAHFFGMEPWIHQPTSTLSGGQKQLTTLASVLAVQPKILLLDEPTAQLDPVAEKNFLHALFRINRELGITIVVSTHTPQTMSNYATEAVLLENGILSCSAQESAMLPPQSDKARGEGSYKSLLKEDGLDDSCRLRKDGTDESRSHESATNALVLRDVHFKYDRDKQEVLRNLSIAVQEGSIHALVGGNGCGKSTLLRVMAGALKPQHGKVTNTYTKHQSLLPQNPKALFVCDKVEEELREWQATSGFTDLAISEMTTALDLNLVLENHPFDLSGGQQQLVALAKVLLTVPQLILLDEPTKGLDASSRQAVATLLTQCKHEGKTIVIATHDLAFAQQVADRVSLIFDGEDACTEPTHQFFENNLFYRPEGA